MTALTTIALGIAIAAAAIGIASVAVIAAVFLCRLGWRLDRDGVR
jgi:hypothetical protein